MSVLRPILGQEAWLVYYGTYKAMLAQAAQAIADAKSDVIVAVSLPAVRAALRAAPDTPIVASFIDDPVSEKLATSLSRPSGTVTGIAMRASEGDKKRLELLREAIPAARRFGYLASPSTGSSLASMKQTASLLGIEIIGVEASDGSEYRAVFDVLRDARVDGVIIASSPVFYRDAAPLAALATERRMATVCEWREMAGAGCLIGYGPNLDELRARTADFVVRLLAGGKVSDMPFEQPTHFELGINAKTARAIGVELPAALLARADEVIE
jgi:putative ABC transport system substrate-binding protein